MVPSFLRPRSARPRVGSQSPAISPSFEQRNPRVPVADFTEADEDEDDDDDDDDEEDEEEDERGQGHRAFGRPSRFPDEDPNEDPDDEGDEDGQRDALPVLPLFSASHLDSLPVYSITHAIRIIVIARTETSLTWDQLRSPQVSQFLVKPMQRQIRTQHFTRATIYALMANCLQFTKEAQRYAANAGTSHTRAKVCELLALKILKEYSTRELIDALAYDFHPLQGLPGLSSSDLAIGASSKKGGLNPSRTSTLEVAIRASAKHFLAHPVVVQQLEAIWSGAITFYSAADSLHRAPPNSPSRTLNGRVGKPNATTPLLGKVSSKDQHPHVSPGRRTVMLYDPRQASMLKLSRLRVPRYRSFLSTLSLAILIGLFLAVLIQRSTKITGLELVFWFWSAGFMLDELVGFNEQGFALFVMSVWNLVDLGILVLLIVYYCMRAYGVFMADPHHWNDMAYDVLAANAILLLPRIFSALDHYQYFSQLLIAFRLMAVDLVAVLVLVLIMCSGFYVFFVLSDNKNDGGEVAFKIFQLLMGFTPAAWDVWPTYNWLGRGLLVLFLFICHFLVVTILITVLTNSFMAIASNATEEHQFLFAINTISIVKNDALFSYIAPSNIFAWLLMPLRYCMPLKEFVWLNRTIIKITHFPVLFCIYLYERLWLASSVFEPTDLIDNSSGGRDRALAFVDAANRSAMFSPNVRVREESVAGFQKDRALEEVFRRMPEPATLRTQRRNERQKAQTAIRNWMDQHDEDGGAQSNWPTMDSRAVPDWHRRLSAGRDRPSQLRHMSDVRSTASDPADLMSNVGGLPTFPRRPLRKDVVLMAPDYKENTDADGDDELVTNDEDEEDNVTHDVSSRKGAMESQADPEGDYFTAPVTSRFVKLASSAGSSERGVPATPRQAAPRRVAMHSRTMSTNTILYNPGEGKPAQRAVHSSSSAASHGRADQTGSGRQSGRSGGDKTPGKRASPRRRSPQRPTATAATQPRPVTAPRGLTDNGGISRTALMSIDPRNRPRDARRLPSVDMSMVSGDTSLRYANDDVHGGMAGSFQTQMAMAMMKDNQRRVAGNIDAADRDRMGRLVLARMKTLEEGFADIIKEVRAMKESGPSTRRNSDTEFKGQPAKRAKGDTTPNKAGGKRPVSRRSWKEPKDIKGKGKRVVYSSDDEADGDEGFGRRGSSM